MLGHKLTVSNNTANMIPLIALIIWVFLSLLLSTIGLFLSIFSLILFIISFILSAIAQVLVLEAEKGPTIQEHIDSGMNRDKSVLPFGIPDSETTVQDGKLLLETENPKDTPTLITEPASIIKKRESRRRWVFNPQYMCFWGLLDLRLIFL